MADREDANSYLARSTIEILTHYMGNTGKAIATRLAELNGEMPPIMSDSTEEAAPPRLQPPEKQISWGITRRDGKFAVAILTEAKDSDANRIAERIERDYGGHVVRRITARAHSIDPTTVPGNSYQAFARGLTPGASIGHVSGYPGTIGGFARSTTVGENWIGAISASHVLGRNNKSQTGDDIISPGHPDGPKMNTNKIGTLERFIMLTRFEDDAPGNYLCCPDIALVKLTESKRNSLPDATLVCCPETPDKLMPIKEVIGGDNVANRLGHPVYKVGRTTKLTRGVLEIVGLQRQPIRLGNDHYVYTNVLAVASEGDAPFSKPGDSGALVYTDDGCAIGLVIAGTDQVSYLSPLDACLREIDATLMQ